ncbi:E3 ubiquitin-protein ligase HECTD3-like isoform X2 [Ptychodera flava]|uniref:E3 ubiquitin-protein ligase HECTD3-like isoform X2 n=1 Tax=Ptychodera flava TaxID=63121 RepID=UPI00396A82F0
MSSQVQDKPTTRLARIRCLQECITCFRDHKSLPEALCFVPAELVYKPNSAGASNKLVAYTQPNKNSKKCGEIVLKDGVKIYASGEELCNNQGQWLKLTKKSLDLHFNGCNVTEAWILLFDIRASNEDEATLVSCEEVQPNFVRQRMFGAQPKLITSWEGVIEQKYSLQLKRNCRIADCDENAMQKLQTPPTNWTIEYDEELAKFLCEHIQQGGENLGSVSQYVESVDVSSSCDEENAACLTDGDANTYWESDGSQGQHWIRIQMKRGTVIKKLFLTVDSEDDNYMPSRIVVMGGEMDNLRKLNDTRLDLSFSGDICVLEDMTEHYQVIEIRIKECKDDGVDTRIHGIKIKSSKEKDLGLNRDLFAADSLVRYPKLELIDIDVLYRRALALQRFIKLVDSVIEYIVPAWEFSIGSFSTLEVVRQLLPLSKKRVPLIETFLRESETSKPSRMPKLYINRRTAAEHKSNPSLDIDCKNAIFTQIYEGLKPNEKYEKALDFRWPQRYDQWWECKFLSEGIIDQGGGFRDSLSDMSDELCPTDGEAPVPLPFFIRSPNQTQDNSNINRDNYIPNPSCKELAKYEWIGQLMGGCLRSKEHLVLALPSYVWKQLAGERVSWARDFITVDAAEVKLIETIESMDRETFDANFAGELTYTVVLSDHSIIPLVEGGADKCVQYDDRQKYCKEVQGVRMKECKLQTDSIRRGLLKVIPQAVLDLLTWQELEKRICGDPEITVEALKKTTYYEDLEQTDTRVKYLWEAMTNFTNEDRSRFLRFVTGRRRLPAPLYVCPDKRSDSADALPESSTCSSTLFLPNYSSARVAEEKLRYAAYNCVAIDTDMSPWDE